MIQHRDHGSCPPTSLPSASHSRFSSGNSSLYHLLFAKAQGEWLRAKKTCVLASLKSGFVSSRLRLCLGDRNLAAFHHWTFCGLLIPARVLWAGEPRLGSRRQSSQAEAPISVLSLCNLSLPPVGEGQIGSRPHPSYWSPGGFHPPWLKVSSSDSLQLVSQGDCFLVLFSGWL